jgi:hypothetical protein
MEKPNVEDWLVWATENGVSPLIRAFVHTFPRVLASYRDSGQEDNPYIFNPKKPVLSFVSPRSLEKASVIVDNRDKLGDNATMVALSGTIGASASADMSAFLRLEKELPTFTEILEKPETTNMPDSISAQLMLMFQAVDKIKQQSDLTAFMKYIGRIKSSEIQAIFFTMMMRNTKSVKIARGNKEIADWAVENFNIM